MFRFSIRDALWLMLVAGTLCPNAASAQEQAVVLSIDDIGKTVTLVGSLGKPLGTMMEIKGIWRYPGPRVKDDIMRFMVDHVDGNALETPVEFSAAQITAISKDGKQAIPNYEERRKLDGVPWTLRAYETGRINIVPVDYWTEKELKGVPAAPYWFRPFTPELVGVVQDRESTQKRRLR
jgi:hypothetical protein